LSREHDFQYFFAIHPVLNTICAERRSGTPESFFL
jgi:hypothetical protein